MTGPLKIVIDSAMKFWEISQQWEEVSDFLSYGFPPSHPLSS